jgi:hypothetical protein
MWLVLRYMISRFIEVCTKGKPKECQPNVDQPEAWTLNVEISLIAPPESLSGTNHTVKTPCVTQQLEHDTEQAEHLSALKSYYFISSKPG